MEWPVDKDVNPMFLDALPVPQAISGAVLCKTIDGGQVIPCEGSAAREFFRICPICGGDKGHSYEKSDLES